VLFTGQMYARLGYQWASSLLAFIALACCAIPFVFYFYGARIRKRSKYAYSGDDEENTNKTGAADSHGNERASEAELQRQQSYVSVP